MIDVRHGQVGLAEVSDVLRATDQQRIVVLVPTAAGRVSAETIALGVGVERPHVLNTRVLSADELARSVLVAAGLGVPQVVDTSTRRGLLHQFLADRRLLDGAHPGEREADFNRAFDDIRLAPNRIATTPAGWSAITDLLPAWEATLASVGMTDRVGLLCSAQHSIETNDQQVSVARWWANVDHLVVADAHRFPVPTQRTIAALIGTHRPGHTFTTIWGASVPEPLAAVLNDPSTQPASRAAQQRLIRCGHPALEAEAAVGVVAAHPTVAFCDIAIVATHRDQLRGVARAARRAGIPVSGAPAPRLEGPVVAYVVALARCADPAVTPPALMRSVLRQRAKALGSTTVEGETLMSLYTHSARHTHLTAAEWADVVATSPVAPEPPAAAPTNAVSLCTVEDLLDRVSPPQLTVLIGCVEGVLPSRRPHRSLDPALLAGQHGTAAADVQHIASQRDRFNSVALVTAPCGEVVYIAAPEPGVLVSRFTEGISAEAPTFAARQLDTERWPIGLTPTVNQRPLVHGNSLNLSASQINLFDNCPWQYTVQYRLNLRTEGGLQARFGTYIHTVLERFVAGIGSTIPIVPTPPDAPIPNPHGSTLDGLLALADECWTTDITDHTPQEDDYRGRAAIMLTNWWERDGQDLVNSRKAAFTEYRFQVAVGDHLVTGFIDRIDRIELAANPASDAHHGLSIIDYKTASKAKTVADTNEDLQLAVYHLAANLDPTLSQLGKVVALNLDFLAENKQVSQRIQPDHAALTTQRIVAVADRMLAEESHPSVDAACDYCDLARLCDLQAEGRPVPVRFGTHS